MIEYIKHNERNISAYLNGRLITKEGYKLRNGSFSNDDDILVTLDDLNEEIINSLPMHTGFFMMKEIPGTNFILTRIDKHDKTFAIEITADQKTFYDSMWNANNYIRRFSELSNEFEIESIDYEDIEHPMIVMIFEQEYDSNTKIGDIFSRAFGLLHSIKNLVELELKGFKWKREYDSDEILFCNEVLTPLFRKMNLLNLEFTHGTTEHGKDYVFSEYTKFGTINHSAAQVKAGDLTGTATGKLKEIIEQLNDAFVIPYEQINSEEKKYIDTFYIVTSGKITSQAIEKIKFKIRPELKGSVKFLDKHAILSLIDQYWR